MKKIILTALLLALLTSAISCEKNNEVEQQETQTTTNEIENETFTSDDEPRVLMPNPIKTVENLEEMEKQLGYKVPLLDKDVELYTVIVVNGDEPNFGRIEYKDGATFSITTDDDADISGIYGADFLEEIEISDIPVNFYLYNDLEYAIWENDDFTYCLTNGNDKELSALIEEVTALING